MPAENGANGAADGYVVPLLINGQDVTTENTFPVESPVSHSTIWTSSSASASDTDAAIAAASAAFPSWARSKPRERRAILLKAADLLEQRKDEYSGYMSQEMGAGEIFTGFNNSTAAELIRDVAGRTAAIMGSIPICQDEGTSALVLKEPFGVVLAIAPWNAPYILGIRSVLYALAAGNTCILKGSELAPRCFHSIGRLFLDAGLPPGCLNIIYTTRSESGPITTRLVAAPAVRKINFTGSTAVGAIIASLAGQHLKPCLMELGGKAAAIVLDDADVSVAAMQCAVGAFLNSGQVCMSTERIVVTSGVVNAFRDALKEAIAKFSPDHHAPPVLVQSAGVERNRRLVGQAVEKGARVLHGDHEREELHPETKEASTTRMRPIVVDGVSKDMDLYHEESFGPSVSLIEVRDEEEAVSVANDTDYGLTSAVFTTDLARALRVAKRIESGAVHINSMSVHDEATLPHGGVKKSGWGRFNAQWGIEEFLKTKTITFKD
ncbi:aldehyde dehydrogenase [Saccharata proteae CBS 121410]|uniref:Aldehyde dehydrogenase n=1 Tax=Saccharata proteae CBS 121410 TaxID=1314787 RepID=A0A9P4HYG4_9PEZI|nr:aldehyde dehydrogenase [Saccharata proteae CBS 121410]